MCDEEQEGELRCEFLGTNSKKSRKLSSNLRELVTNNWSKLICSLRELIQQFEKPLRELINFWGRNKDLRELISKKCEEIHL